MVSLLEHELINRCSKGKLSLFFQLYSSHLVGKNLLFSSNRRLLNSTVCLWPCTLTHWAFILYSCQIELPNDYVKCEKSRYFQPRVHHNHVLRWFEKWFRRAARTPFSINIQSMDACQAEGKQRIQFQPASVGGRWGILTERLPLQWWPSDLITFGIDSQTFTAA